jgi:chemotaxis protein MotA
MKKHDHCTAFGLICGFMVIMASAIWGKKDIWGNLVLFYDVPSIFIVICGSFCAIVVSFEWETIKSVPFILKNAFITKQLSKKELLKMFVDFSKEARRAGILSLEDSVVKVKDQFLKSGMMLIVDGSDEETVRRIKTLEIEKTVERHKKCIQLFRMWANLAPSFGMLGTFMGLIQMMGNFSDMSKFSSAFATVLVTSFYGVILANLVFSPLANKLDIRNSEEVNRMEMMLEGIIGIRSGLSPRVIQDNLKVFLSPAEQLEVELVSLKSYKDDMKKDSKHDVA